jgi:hypothetical protein
VLYACYSQHQFLCRRAIRMIFATPFSLYTRYTHHIRNTRFSVDVSYAFCRASRNSAAVHICYSSILIKSNSPSRIWQSGPEPTRLRRVDARDKQGFHSEAPLTSFSMRDNFSFVAKFFKLSFLIIYPNL